MRRQVPDHVHIVLEEAQVHARGIKVIQISQSAVIDELANFSDRSAEEERVIHHDLEVLAFGEFDEFFGLARVCGEGLFDKHMLAVHKGRLASLEGFQTRVTMACSLTSLQFGWPE